MITIRPPDDAPLEILEAYHAKSNLEKWGPGPWVDEPDREFWKSHGLDCLAQRGPMGAWCGYVGVPKSHPHFGKRYDEVEVEVHGGLTYGSHCQGHICHEHDDGGEPVFWFGFDCSHCFDLAPAMAALRQIDPELQRLHERLQKLHSGETYRDLAYVKSEIESLAQQLASVPRETLEG